MKHLRDVGIGAVLAVTVMLTASTALAALGEMGGTTRQYDDVEQRIAAFWARVDAMQPSDFLSTTDLGQWALNVIDRDARARLTVADFRGSTAQMQAALDRAGRAATAPTPTPSPNPAAFTFGSGKKIIGTDIPAGTYRTRAAAAGCYWERESGLGGTFGEIIANGNNDGPEVVTIAPTDKGFNSSRCQAWSADLSAIKAPAEPFGTGTYIVGVDIAPGTWRSSGGTTCYWERMQAFTGSFNDIIANENTGPSATVTIAPSDRGFRSSRCGTWMKIG
ncbi:MAG: hypothetical protein M3R54_08095 [Chloroflexota bacterium]|nr:hypothetical protein [Chloroflexota bacterium]